MTTQEKNAIATKLLGDMVLIRCFEERLLQLFDEGLLVGTTHCYIGQEANAAGVIAHLNDKDIIWSNHRCHGHYLTHTKDVNGLMAELMGKSTGVVGGRGGSQHLCGQSFFSNGVQGGITGTGLGMAFAQKFQRTGGIVTIFIGDGTLGEGLVYESLNIASLWGLPVLYVIENNQYAQSTPTHRQLSGSIKGRTEAFGISTTELSTFNALEIYESAGTLVRQVRETLKPAALILNTYRFCHHSKSDDNRDPAEVEEWKKNDPIDLLKAEIAQEVYGELAAKATDQVKQAEGLAREAPLPVFDKFNLEADLLR